MPSKQLEARHSQGKLLDHRDHDGIGIVQPGETFGDAPGLSERVDSSFSDVPVSDSEVSVNIKTRAENLKAALEALSISNEKAGLSKVAPHRREIKERYGDKKGKEAAKEAKDLLEEARQHFWKAHGHRVLKAAKIFSPEDLGLDLDTDELEERVDFKDLDADVRLLWSEFRRNYAKTGRKAEKKRKDFIDQLENIIENSSS